MDEDQLEDADIAIFAFGSSARSAMEAVEIARQRGLKVGLLKAKTLWPFPENYVEKWTRRVKAWVVPEMNLGQMVPEVALVVKGRVPVYPLNRVDGLLIEPHQILSLIETKVLSLASRSHRMPNIHTADLLDQYFLKERLPTIWCPGCGLCTANGAILRGFEAAGIDQDKTVLVNGIGSSGRTAAYLDFDVLKGTHGRAIAFATGVKLYRPELNVIVMAGDGDTLAIGGNHFIHAARRNVDLKVILFNNFIYGMTGGQVSPQPPRVRRLRPRPRAITRGPLMPASWRKQLALHL